MALDYKAKETHSQNCVLPQGFMVLEVYLNPLWMLKVYSKQNSMKISFFPLFFTELKAWKLLNQCDTKKCIWYGRPIKSMCFCSVKCVVVKLVFLNGKHLSVLWEQFISLPLFIWVFCSSWCIQETLPKQMFAFLKKSVILLLLDLKTLLMIISNVIFYMCKDAKKIIVRITLEWSLSKGCEFSRDSNYKAGKFVKATITPNSQLLEKKRIMKKEKNCNKVEAGC